MKAIPTLLFAAAALLPLAACSPDVKHEQILLPEPMPVLPEGWSYHYEPADKDFCQQLHDACRRCTSVEFSYGGSDNERDLVRVSRQEAEPALERILAIKDWSKRNILVSGKKRPHSPSPHPLIRFLDAEGNDILALHDYPYAPPTENGWRPSLWSIFSNNMWREKP